MKKVSLISIRCMPIIKEGDDLSEVILEACVNDSISIENGDVIVVAQKIVSKSEGALVDLKTITPSQNAKNIAAQTGRDARLVQVYLDECSEVLFIKGRMVITKHKLGFKMSSSGVDKSNIGPLSKEIVVLLPRNPDASAQKIRSSIKRETGKEVAVIINDSCGRDDRDGSIGMAIGIAGISHLEFRFQSDLFGNNSNSKIALVDEIAAAASILMGQANESIPAVIVKGVSYTVDEQAKIVNILNQ